MKFPFLFIFLFTCTIGFSQPSIYKSVYLFPNFGSTHFVPQNQNNLPFTSIKITIHRLISANQRASGSGIYGIVATLGYGKLRYTFDNEDIIKFNYSLTKSGGVSIDFPLEIMDGKVHIYNELTFSQFEAKATETIIDTNQYGFPVSFDSKYNFSPNLLGIAHIIRYNLTPNDFKYFVGVGVYNNFLIGTTNSKVTHVTTQTDQYNLYDKAIPKPSIHGIMLLASTGFIFRNIGFEIRYDPGRNYTNLIENYVFQQVFTAHLHVRFNAR